MGCNSAVTPHKLRHSFATQLLEKGADIFTIQELMGHADLASNRVYTHCSTRRCARRWSGSGRAARRNEQE